MKLDIVDATNNVKCAPIVRAEKSLTELRRVMRNEGATEWARELMPIILILREALE